MDSFASNIISGGIETSQNNKVTVDAHELQQSVYASCGSSGKLKFSLYITFRYVGQDAASKTAAVINTCRWR